MIYNLWSDYNRPMKGEGPFFTDYWSNVQSDSYPYVGLEYANWDSDRYPYLCEREEILLKRFNERYAYREIGQETAVRFQHFLSMRFDEVAENINHMYSVYANNDVDNIGLGYVDTDTYLGNAYGTSSTDNTGTEVTTAEGSVAYDSTDSVESSSRNYGSTVVESSSEDSTTYNSQIANTGTDTLTETTADGRTIHKEGDAKYKDTPYGEDDAWNNPTNQQVEESESYVEGELVTTSVNIPNNLNSHTGTDSSDSSGKTTSTPDLYSSSSGSASSDRDTTTSDTETFEINRNASNEYNDTKSYTRTLERVENDEHIIEEVNTIAEKYKTIDNIFIDCFEPLFISIVAMI